MAETDRLSALFEFATEGILITNRMGEIVLANPMAGRQFGYKSSELIGKRVEDLIPQRFSKTHSHHREQYYDNPKPRSMGMGLNLFAKRSDGSEFPVEVSLSAFHDKGELFVIAFTIDITLRKEAEDELRREKEQAQSYLELAPILFVVLDKDQKVTLINKTGCEILGYTEEEIIGKEWFSHFVPAEDRAKGIEIFKSLMEGNDIAEYENSIVTKKGRKRIISWRNTILRDKNGKPTGTLRSGDDITEEKEHAKAMEKANYEAQKYAEEIALLNEGLEIKVAERTEELRESQKLYSAIARNFPNGIIAVLDRDMQYVFVEGKELYGLGLSRENIIGGRVFQFTAPEKTEMVEEQIRKVFNEQKVTFETQIGDNYYSINGVPLTDIRGEITQALLVIENITEEKKSEASLMKALQKEKDLNEMKSRFVSMASHEFRTPLGTILSSITLVEKYHELSDAEKRLKHISRIKSSVHNLTNILDDFLSLGKLEEGKIGIHPIEFDIVKLVQGIIQELQMAAKPGQKIVFKAEGNIQPINTDNQIVRNVLNNLLSNAIKYSPPEKNIYLTLKFDESGITIEVKDHGIGIPAFEQEHLFERFFRASNATNISGTGLGLSIVKRYLDLLNGTIECRSELDKGTTFTIYIPKELNQ